MRGPRPRRLTSRTALAAAALFLPSFCPAQTAWKAGTANWSTAANWTLGVPNSLADAVIANGGTAQITAAGAAARTLRVGRPTGGGNLLVSGPGTLDVATNLYVNENGIAPAAVTVQNGATVNTPLTAVGVSDAASAPAASLTLSGAGTTYNSPVFTVGLSRAGATTLTVQSGAALNTTGANVGTGFLANSTATVTGANSKWTNTGTLTVSDGTLDTGVLNLNAGGTVYTDGLSIGAAGTVNLNGGTLRTNTYARHASGHFNFTAGTLQLAGTRHFLDDPTLADIFGNNPVLPTGKTLNIEFYAIVQSRTLALAGGSLITQNLDIGLQSAGAVTISAGGALSVHTASVGNRNSTLTVTDPTSSFTATNLLVLGTATVQNQGRLSVDNELLNGGTINLAGGTVRLRSYSGDDGVFNYTSGTLEFAGNRTIDTDPTVAKFFTAGTGVAAAKTLAVEGNATLSSAAPFTLAGGTLTAPTLTLNTGSRLLATLPSNAVAVVLALPNSVIDATAANLTIGDSTKPNGFYSGGNLLAGPSRTLTLADANDALLDSASLTTLAGGTLSAPNGLTLNFGGNVTGQGTLSTPNNPAKPLTNNGHITGASPAQRLTLTGHVKGVGSLDNVTITGTLSPGFSPATVYYGSMSYAGTLQLDVSPAGADMLIHSGPASLGGKLELLTAPGPAASRLSRFTVLTATSVTGTFSTVAGYYLDAAHAYALIYKPTSLELVLTLPGDANLDGAVTPADVAILSASSAANRTNAHWTDGDFNYDRRVTPDDFALLALGRAASASAASDVVPEPLSLLMPGSWAAATRFLRRPRQTQHRRPRH